jgi:hypothetical protein
MLRPQMPGSSGQPPAHVSPFALELTHGRADLAPGRGIDVGVLDELVDRAQRIADSFNCISARFIRLHSAVKGLSPNESPEGDHHGRQ